MKQNDLLRILGASVLLTILSLVMDFLFGNVQGFTAYLWKLLANLLLCGALGFYVLKSYYNGKKLWLHTFIIFYLIGYFNILIEALIFNVTDQWQTTKDLQIGLPITAIGSFILVWILGKWTAQEIEKPSFAKRKVFSWIWRILTTNVLYFIFYSIGGMVFYLSMSRFEEFYQDKIPPFLLIILTNLCFRGFIFVAIAILIDRTMEGKNFIKALTVGAIFSILGGIAPLIPPNEFMPAFIRIGHGFEVGVSNMLYGICAFYIMRIPEKT